MQSSTMQGHPHRFYGGRDLHFVTFSCYQRQPLLDHPRLCDLFLEILERVRRRYRLVVLGYVIMPEHVHLLVSEPQRSTLSTAIQALKLGVVRSLDGDEVPRSRKIGETWGTHFFSISTKKTDYTRPWSSIALATFRKPPMLAPFTRLPGVPYFSAVSKQFL
jgi:REP element-mobilizing transposase RayT